MSTALDRIISAVLDALRQSRYQESGSVLATVSVRSADGTITATRNGDTFPKVRVIGASAPAVGSLVLIHRTMGGWVALGSPRTTI